MERTGLLFTVWICVLPAISCTSSPRESNKQNLTCYTCSYQHPPTADHECVDSPAEVKTANVVKCPAGRLCVTREVYDKASGVITSFNRGCENAPVSTQCDPSGQTRVCTYSCTTNLCNGQLGGKVEDDVNARTNPGEQKGPGSKASAAATHWMAYSVALIVSLCSVITEST